MTDYNQKETPDTRLTAGCNLVLSLVYRCGRYHTYDLNFSSEEAFVFAGSEKKEHPKLKKGALQNEP